MSDAPVVGSAAFELRATKKKLGEDIRASERDLKAAMGRIEDDANRSSKSIGNSISGMARGIALGFTALTAVFAAGLAMALKFGQASLKMADDLANSARRIGMSTTALQEWQYVARKSGSTAIEAGAALEAFASKWEQAQAGLNKEASKSFAALGFSQEKLRSFKDAEQALDAVTDRIGALSSASDRAAIAEKLGLGALATALREGSDEVDRLRGEAAALGFVMDAEVIQKGADAQGQLEDLAQVIGIQMAEAFIDLSDEVLAFAQQCAARFIGKPLDFKQYDCVRQARYVLHLRKQSTGLLKGVKWGSEAGAYRAMRKLGFASLIEGVDAAGLLAIPFSMVRPADLVAMPGDDAFGCSIGVYLGDGYVSGYQDGADVGVSIKLAPDFVPLKVWMV